MWNCVRMICNYPGGPRVYTQQMDVQVRFVRDHCYGHWGTWLKMNNVNCKVSNKFKDKNSE